MFKKTLVICVLFCFFTATLSVQAMAYSTQPSVVSGEKQRANRLAEFKQKFYDVNVLGREIIAYRSGNLELTEKERTAIRATLQRDLASCFDELGRAEYQPLFRLIQRFTDTNFPEPLTAALNAISAVLQSNPSSEEKTAAGIGTLTIIGAPIGLPIYVLSWAVYFIAKSFEDDLNTFGFFLFVVSVIMEILGAYFIL